ncbi:hypothetical protein E9549_09270 [Blastococcus sp. MG754426]|uniref:hypothetical protein n=1 Tax=unclassified Blastococcus TaxID=2619396 RepID=UPI001EF0B1F4|nr:MULTISPECIES: hypothetical protein [unclassified Blastococcus]MCF6507593.1 hypothetical protein [Blastococcus sp. MG754426]MCF6511985.1 hypothetical protein [Blastococcus sp. MG754427]MCF6735190.1 hypothetical protein [Blastococcus sp. KM273129]
MKRVLAWVAGAAVVAAAVLLLRAELMTVHVPLPEGSYTDVVLAVEIREDPALREEMTRGLVSTCRLLVNADVVEDSFGTVGDGVYAFRLRPGLDEFDRREMQGCLRDTRVQHLLADVRRIATVTPEEAAGR